MQRIDYDYMERHGIDVTVYTLTEFYRHLSGGHKPNETGPTLWACYVDGELHTMCNVTKPRPAEATHVVFVEF